MFRAGKITHVMLILKINRYSRSSRKRPPQKFEKVVVTRTGRLQEWSQGKLRLYYIGPPENIHYDGWCGLFIASERPTL